MKSIYFIILHYSTVFIVVNGAHFLGGTITWHPLNDSATGTPVAIVITQTYSWTYALITCTDTMIATNQFIPSYGGSLLTLQLNCIVNCGAGSVGYSAINIIPRCTDFSAPVGTTVGQRSDTVYLQSGDDFSVAFQYNAWRPLATSASASWSISTRINIQPRSDNGLYNNAPVATMMSPINIPVNQPTVIQIPISDADGDTLRCRWSTNTNGVDECGGVCPPSSLPPSTIIYPNCTIIITGQNVGNWFGVALMVEDFINSTSTTPLSSVPVQFLVRVVSSPPCTTPPKIIGLPLEQSCTSVIVGQPFISQLIAINNCGPNVTISDIATLSFSGMVSSNISELNSTLYYKNLTWTPTSAQLGFQVMCAMAFDSQSAQSAQYCFKFYVSQNGVCSCPGEPCITTTSTTSTTSTSSSTSTTSTTRTSTTSTSTTTTTTTRKPDSINWPLIGSIIGLVFLAALALCCCVCWRYFYPLGRSKYVFEKEGIIELYHIDRCIDPNCSWIDNENNNTAIHTNFKICLEKNIDLKKTMSGISVSSVRKHDTKRNEENPDLKPPKSQTNHDEDDICPSKVRKHSTKRNEENPDMKPPKSQTNHYEDDICLSKVRKHSTKRNEENPDMKPPKSQTNHYEDDICLSKVRKHSTKRNEENPDLKPPKSQTNHDEDDICLSKVRKHSTKRNEENPDMKPPKSQTNHYKDDICPSKVRKHSTKRNDENPDMKPPKSQTNHYEDNICLSKFENNKIHARYKTGQIRSGIKVTRLRSKRPVMIHQSSIDALRPSIIVNTIYLDTETNSIK